MPETTTAAATLVEAAREVLETMFFAASWGEIPPGTELPPGEFVAARLRFRGTPPGSCAVSVSEAAARTLAANFLGAERESDVSSDQVGDVVCELANMICGSVLSRLEADSEFELGKPELVERLENPHAGRPLVRTLALEEGVLRASIEFRPAK